MVLLGGLVVGIVYDVNMFLGVGVIVVSFLCDCIDMVKVVYEEKLLINKIMVLFLGEVE